MSQPPPFIPKRKATALEALEAIYAWSQKCKVMTQVNNEWKPPFTLMAEVLHEQYPDDERYQLPLPKPAPPPPSLTVMPGGVYDDEDIPF